MTNPDDLPELEPLEHLDDLDDLEPLEPLPGAAVSTAPSMMEPVVAQLRTGLPAPAYNPNADKAYYRFLFAGVLIVVGCLMPFGMSYDGTMAYDTGYKTLPGAIFLIIGLGMVWSWWGAISLNRFAGANLKWVGLCLIPFISILMVLLSEFDRETITSNSESFPDGWGGVFSDISGAWFGAEKAEAWNRLDRFGQVVGSGKILVFIGSLLAELFFVLSIFGGAKAVKQQKLAKQQAAAQRRKR